MADIARLGFSANTGDLKKAKADLDALVPSATKAGTATDKFNRAAAGITTNATGASAGIKSFNAAATGASASTNRLGKAALSAGTAMGTVQRAAVGASAGMNNLVATTSRVGFMFAQADAHVAAYQAELAKIPAAANTASSSLSRLGAAANDNINAMQATPGNIAAQFQDIAVTAAGDMNPMLIALQQGTQLASALQGGLGNLIDGFRQLFGVTTILTVGLVGLAAAGLQMVDWVKVAQTVLESLSAALKQFKQEIMLVGGVLLLAFGPQIIAWITTTTVAIGVRLVGALKAAAIWLYAFAAANPFTAFVLAAGIAVAIMHQFGMTFDEMIPYVIALGGVFIAVFGGPILASITSAIVGVASFALSIVTTLIPAVVSAGVALVTGFIPAVMAAIGAMIAFTVANPFTLIAIGIGIVIAALALMTDAFGISFSDVVKWAKDAINFIIGGFVGAFNAIKATWRLLPGALGDLAIQAANATIRAIRSMVVEAIKAINPLLGMAANFGADYVFGKPGGDVLDNPWAGEADQVGGIISAEMGKAQGVDYVTGIGDGISSGMDWLADKASGLAGSLGLSDKKKGKDKKGKDKGGKSELEKIAEAYKDLIASTEKRIKALGVETTALGMSEHAARLYRNQQDLIAQALEKNIPLTDKVKQKLGELAQTLTDAELAKVTAEATKAFEDQQKALKDQANLIGLTGLELAFNVEYQRLLNQAIEDGKVDLANMNDEMRQYVALLGERAMALALDQTVNADAEFLDKATKAHEERMIAMRRERGEIGLTGVALEKYRLDTELLVEAERGIASPETIEKMRQMGYEHIELTEAIRKQREEIEFHRDTFRGFIEDMIGGLRQGQSVWEAFGNAVLNVVNKIIDRLLDQALDGLFNNKDGSAGGLLGSIGNLFVKKNALGGAYGNSGIERFANGGAFTNGIYNSPTLFKFAKGGALGMMGEAGPEAVMPLKRGPDGSLGVQMHGPQTVNVQIGVNDDRFNAYVDNRSGMQVAAAAPTIASAGGQVAQAKMAAQRRRSIT